MEKANFNVPLPASYIPDVWDYKNAKRENIHNSVSSIDWDFIFQGKTVNKKVNILNKCLFPIKKIKFNHKDP